MTESRIPGFYKLSVSERRKRAAELLGLSEAALSSVLDSGGLEVERADKTVENVIGTFSLPFCLGLNVCINGEDFLAPMTVEEPSVVAAVSNAAKMIRAGGGFCAQADPPHMIAQVELHDVDHSAQTIHAIEEAREALMVLGDKAVPGLVARGGGVVDLEVRDLGDGFVVVHFIVDCQDAMGANLVNTVAEAAAPIIQTIANNSGGGSVGLRILSNLADRRKVRVRARIPAISLGLGSFTGERVRDGIVLASRFAEKDPYRAATHNKGIMNGVDAVVIATGNDWRAVEAGAHAYAARNGSYSPLCTWSKDEDGNLVGDLELPLALGIVGGPTRVHEGVKLGLKMTGVESASALAMLVASVGMASNLAALRALASDGIQRGHMALHARSVAVAAGAGGNEVEKVAHRIHRLGDVTLQAAHAALAQLRDSMKQDPKLSPVSSHGFAQPAP